MSPKLKSAAGRKPIADDAIARIWILRGKGKTIEETADELQSLKVPGMSTRTVRKYCDKETAARLRATFKLIEAQQKTPAG
jgi:hypothetical protein